MATARSATTRSANGILLLVATLFVFAAMEALAKRLSADYPVIEIVWVRYVVHVAAMLPVLISRGPVLLVSARPALQLLRSLFMLGMTLFFFLGISVLPLADATALMFVGPAIVTLLSVVVLRERVGWRRLLAVGVGFCGMIILVRPGAGAMQWAALLPLAAATSFAALQVTTRLVSAKDPAMTTLAYSGSVGLVVGTIAVPFVWVTPDPVGWAGLIAVGLMAAGGNYLLIRAFQAAPASVLAPVNYVHLLWATAFGWLLFDQLPDGWTLLGAAVIGASGLYIFRREARRAVR